MLVTKYDIYVAFWSYHLLNTYCCWTGKKQHMCCYLIECSTNNEKGRGGGGEKKVSAGSSQHCAERTVLECEWNSLQLPLDQLSPATYELLAHWQKNKPCSILLMQRIKPAQPCSALLCCPGASDAFIFQLLNSETAPGLFASLSELSCRCWRCSCVFWCMHD